MERYFFSKVEASLKRGVQRISRSWISRTSAPTKSTQTQTPASTPSSSTCEKLTPEQEAALKTAMDVLDQQTASLMGMADRMLNQSDQVFKSLDKMFDSVFRSELKVKRYVLTWKDGRRSTIKGTCLSHAWKEAGHTPEQIAELASYKELQ